MAQPVPDRQDETLDYTFRVPVSREQVAVIERLASARDCSRPAAIRFLIDIHAGKALAGEEAQPPAGGELAPAPFNVIRFGKPRLSRELISYIAGCVAAGLPLEAALDLASVTVKQRREWWRKGSSDHGEGSESLFADYVAAILQAQAQVKMENIETIKRHRSRTFKAGAWLLERGFPEEFGERKRVDSNVRHSLMPMVDLDRLTLTEGRELVRLLRKASPDGAEPGLGARARPAAELLPSDWVDAVEADEADWEPVGEAPALEKPDG